MREMMRKAGKGIVNLDDRIQRMVRKGYGMDDSKPNSAENMDPRKAIFVQAMHPLHSQVDDSMEGKLALIGSRAFQAGTITAAGYGLMQLTEQFGGVADQPQPNELSM